jgi:cyclophilin family peptidyl-prolyl cis-trans isomerase
MRSWFLIVFGVLISGFVITAVIYSKSLSHSQLSDPETHTQMASSLGAPSASVVTSPTHSPSALPGETNLTPDLSTEANGLSKATVILTTSQGVIKFKFYPQEAPKTVKRIIELINQGFYNNLTFHRVVPGFVIQGGDPLGNGTGGSGQKLEAEFNSRHHVEGTLAMARAGDPNSADSQFYISLGTHPHLDRNYTVFGQVTEGLDIVKRIQVGDRMTKVMIH